MFHPKASHHPQPSFPNQKDHVPIDQHDKEEAGNKEFQLNQQNVRTKFRI